MNEGQGLNRENVLEHFPEVLKKSPIWAGLAYAAARELERLGGEEENAAIYARIDELPEALLDILAYDCKVDWWDPNYTVEQKRQTLKDSWRVHRLMGTKAGVETGIRAIYPDAEVVEWWKYDGEPYHFQLRIDSSNEGVDQARHRRVLERADLYKSLRDRLDEVEYRDAGAVAELAGAAVCAGVTLTDGALAV